MNLTLFDTFYKECLHNDTLTYDFKMQGPFNYHFLKNNPLPEKTYIIPLIVMDEETIRRFVAEFKSDNFYIPHKEQQNLITGRNERVKLYDVIRSDGLWGLRIDIIHRETKRGFHIMTIDGLFPINLTQVEIYHKDGKFIHTFATPEIEDDFKNDIVKFTHYYYESDEKGKESILNHSRIGQRFKPQTGKIEELAEYFLIVNSFQDCKIEYDEFMKLMGFDDLFDKTLEDGVSFDTKIKIYVSRVSSMYGRNTDIRPWALEHIKKSIQLFDEYIKTNFDKFNIYVQIPKLRYDVNSGWDFEIFEDLSVETLAFLRMNKIVPNDKDMITKIDTELIKHYPEKFISLSWLIKN